MNQIVAEAYLPLEAYEEIYHPQGEAEQSTPLGNRVEQILSTKPTMALADGKKFDGDPCTAERVRGFVSEAMTYPKMQGLHSLLCSGQDPERISVVENGAGGVPHVSMVLSAMGYHVIVKDPASAVTLAHRRLSMAMLPKAWLGRIAYFNDPDTIKIDTPSFLVYWVNPANTMFRGMQKRRDRTPERLAGLAHYMSRDVMMGGYLVMQTEDDLYSELPFEDSRWHTVFDTTARGRRKLRTPVFPTFCYGIRNHLRILRRTAW